eukprot:CAMPEP_0114395684 /NCGR_PEP_ID=MMETSP0102-20121206/13058_1 /TAXON_ID=38822 ORGANISM="Pteridomonas danica, Strain PT" /NCGR_SAMPLE_ID=MMETSP0102 /ASSEMBLY_ACC=CAM_ASM_000212 /LENGTH=427 /DNA_ID=CAMNT_0001556137 /DNA_START=303 /DNA_END=1583 /DNA_ORIENTATION=+
MKWLGTNITDGKVNRRSLANTWTARAKTNYRQTGGGRPGKTFESLMVKEQIATIRAAFIAFSKQFEENENDMITSKKTKNNKNDDSDNDDGNEDTDNDNKDTESDSDEEVIVEVGSNKKNKKKKKYETETKSDNEANPKANPKGVKMAWLESNPKTSKSKSKSDKKSKLSDKKKSMTFSLSSYFCTVWYNDGTKEHVTPQMFDVLVETRDWLRTILALQSYVPTLSDLENMQKQQATPKQQQQASQQRDSINVTKHYVIRKYTSEVYINEEDDEEKDDGGGLLNKRKKKTTAHKKMPGELPPVPIVKVKIENLCPDSSTSHIDSESNTSTSHSDAISITPSLKQKEAWVDSSASSHLAIEDTTSKLKFDSTSHAIRNVVNCIEHSYINTKQKEEMSGLMKNDDEDEYDINEEENDHNENEEEDDDDD